MIQVVITERDGSVRHEVFDHDEVTIGRVHGNDLRFPEGAISKRHARIVRRADKFIIVDLKSTNGTYVNGRKITSPLVVDETDRVYIGNYALSIGKPDEHDEPTIEVDAVELRLLAGIAQGDEASWLVYADWLEGHGHAARAELLRLELLPIEERASHEVRIRELATTVDPGWRRKIARVAIENCFALDVACPARWSALQPTAKSAIRHCTACARDVLYCATIEEARSKAQRGHCVAVDAANARAPHDLEYTRPYPLRTGMPRVPTYEPPAASGDGFTPTTVRLLPEDTSSADPQGSPPDPSGA